MSLAELFGPKPARDAWNYGWLRIDPSTTRVRGAPRTRGIYFGVGGHGWAPGYYTAVKRFPAEHISVMLFSNDGANGRIFPYLDRIANLALAGSK